MSRRSYVVALAVSCCALLSATVMAQYGNYGVQCTSQCTSCTTTVAFDANTSCVSDSQGTTQQPGPGPGPGGNNLYRQLSCGAVNASTCVYGSVFSDEACTALTEQKSIVCGVCYPGSGGTFFMPVCDANTQQIQVLQNCPNSTCTGCPTAVSVTQTGVCGPNFALPNSFFAMALVRACTSARVTEYNAQTCTGPALQDRWMEVDWCEGDHIANCTGVPPPAPVTFPPVVTTPAPTAAPVPVTFYNCGDSAHCTSSTCTQTQFTAFSCVDVNGTNASLVVGPSPVSSPSCFTIESYVDSSCTNIASTSTVVCNQCQVNAVSNTSTSTYFDCLAVPGSVVVRRGCDASCNVCAVANVTLPLPYTSWTQPGLPLPQCANLTNPAARDGFPNVVIISNITMCYPTSIAFYQGSGCNLDNLLSVQQVAQYDCAAGLRVQSNAWQPSPPNMLPPIPVGSLNPSGQVTISATACADSHCSQGCYNNTFTAGSCIVGVATLVADPSSPMSLLRLPVGYSGQVSCLPGSNLSCADNFQLFDDDKCSALSSVQSYLCNTCNMQFGSYSYVSCDTNTWSVTWSTNCSAGCGQCNVSVPVGLQSCTPIAPGKWAFHRGITKCAGYTYNIFGNTFCAGSPVATINSAQTSCTGGNLYQTCSYTGLTMPAVTGGTFPTTTTTVTTTTVTTTSTTGAGGSTTTSPGGTTTTGAGGSTTTSPGGTTTTGSSGGSTTSSVTTSMPSTTQSGGSTSAVATGNTTASALTTTTTTSSPGSSTAAPTLTFTAVFTGPFSVTAFQTALRNYYSSPSITVNVVSQTSSGSNTTVVFTLPGAPSNIESNFAGLQSADLRSQFGIASLQAAADQPPASTAGSTETAESRLTIIIGAAVGGAVLLVIIAFVVIARRGPRNSGDREMADTEYRMVDMDRVDGKGR